MENPISAIGGALAKGGVSETIKQIRDFLDDYPPIEAFAKGKKVKLVIDLQATVED